MARNYSIKHFFRQMPTALLDDYFLVGSLFSMLAVSDTTEDNASALFEAWRALPDRDRNTMDTDFRDIFEMSCEKGIKAILDEAEFHLSESDLNCFADKLSDLSNHYERAMVTFLHHKTYWKGATHFYHADTLSRWRKRKNLPHQTAAVDDASIQQLAERIRDYFHLTEGRGKNCAVEYFRRGERDYFFAYPEGYSQQSIEWVDGKFNSRPHNPAFEIVYVYSQKEGTLDLNCRGSFKAVEPFQNMFATAILKLDELPPDPKDEHVYDLSPLLNRNFNFNYAVDSGIESVVVKKLRLSSHIKKGDYIELGTDPTQDHEGVYAQLAQMRKSLPLYLFSVTQVELIASVKVDATKPAKNVPIRITYPNSCSLKYDELGLKLRDMLAVSGIEPKTHLVELEAAEVVEA